MGLLAFAGGRGVDGGGYRDVTLVLGLYCCIVGWRVGREGGKGGVGGVSEQGGLIYSKLHAHVTGFKLLNGSLQGGQRFGGFHTLQHVLQYHNNKTLCTKYEQRQYT